MKKRHINSEIALLKASKILLLVFALVATGIWSAKAQVNSRKFADAQIFNLGLQTSGSDLNAKKVTLKYRNVSIEKLLKYLEQTEHVQFSYHKGLLINNPRVTISLKDVTLDKALKVIFKNTSINFYPLKGGYIVLRKSNRKPVQEKVGGTVTDARSGETMPGVNVIVKGTPIGTATDINGEFKINAPSANDTLSFSFIGYEEKDVPIKGRSKINVVLEPKILEGNELVVIGYGSVRKKDLTGSVASTGSDQINQSKSDDLLGALQGKMAGVRISSQSGEPGSSMNIRIRGASSVYGSSSPLFVIDGVPIDVNEDEVATTSVGSSSSANPLATLNPSDIESVRVLKDASATAIYGSRGANGVIIITTKSGQNGKTKFNYGSSVRISNASKTLDVLNANEYIEYQKTINPNSTLFGQDTDNDGVIDVPRDPMTLPAHNWQNEILQTGVSQNHYLSVSGGNDKTTFSGSLGFLDDNAIIRNNNYSKYTGRIKINHDHNDKLSTKLVINSAYSELSGATNAGGTGEFNGLIQRIIIDRPVEYYDPVLDDEEYVSPDNMVDNAYEVNNVFKNIINADLDYKPIKHLQFKISGGGRFITSKGKEFYGSHTSRGKRDNGKAVIQNKQSYTWFNTDQVTYANNFNKIHHINVMGAFEINAYNHEEFSIETVGYPDQSTGVDNIGKANAVSGYGSSRWITHRLSFLSRANYSLKDRYLFTASFRADGSDKFGPGNRYGYFPSGAFAWRISDEPFMQHQNIVSNLKLRLSYGETGNERIPAYSYYASMEPSYYASQGTPQLGLAPASLANPDLKWEQTNQYNMGLDVGLLDDRIDLTIDFYDKQTYDMLLPAITASQTGYQEYWQNIGRVDNKGFEIELNTQNIANKNFHWSTDITFSRNINKVVDLGDLDFIPVVIGAGYYNNVGRVIEGQPIGTGYGYTFDGIYQISDFTWQNNSDPSIPDNDRNYVLKDDVVGVQGATVEPGSFKFKDLNGDSVVDATNDRSVISHSDPKFFGGITNTINFKNLQLSTFFEYSYGGQVINIAKYRYQGYRPYSNVTRNWYYNRWTPENPTNKYPAFDNKTVKYLSDYYTEDASYLRLRTVSVSYNMRNKFTDKLGLQNLKLSATGTNLWIWTKYSGFDPDVTSREDLLTGFDRLAYPRSRSVVFGINFSF